MDEMVNTMLHSSAFLMAVAMLVASGFILILFWEKIKFWVMDFSYIFPFVGRIAMNSKNPSKSHNEGWTNEERSLCSDYYQFASITNERDFTDAARYMKLAGDVGRENMPKWALIFISLLVLAEGYGFSYLLGTWVTLDGNVALYTALSIFIAFVISGIMLWLTHSAGHEIHRNKILNSCDKEARRTQELGTADYTGAKSIGDHSDSGAPLSVQCVNRVADHAGDKGGNMWLIVTVIAMITIAGLSFWMREKSLDQEIQKQVQLQQASAGDAFNQATGGFALPKEVTAPQADADKKISDANAQSRREEGGAAFAMLSIIFIFTQIVSIGFGMKYGFVGKESKNAYRMTKGFSTYNSFYQFFSPIYRIAQSRLQKFQKAMESKSSNRAAHTKTFSDFCEEKAIDERRDKIAASSGVYLQPVVEPVMINPVTTTTPVAPPVVPVDPVVVTAAVNTGAISAAEAMVALSMMSERGDRLAYLSGIQDASVVEEVKSRLMADKAKKDSLAEAEAKFGDFI